MRPLVLAHGPALVTIDDIRRLALEGADPIRVLAELDRRGLSRGRMFDGRGASQRLRAIRPHSFSAMVSFLARMTARRFGLPASIFDELTRHVM